MIPITKQAQREWNIILNIARNNGFPLLIIHNFKNKLMLKTHTIKKKVHPGKHNERKNVTHLHCTVHSYSYQLIQRHFLNLQHYRQPII